MQQAKCYDSWMSREKLKAATTPSFVSNLSCQEPPARCMIKIYGETLRQLVLKPESEGTPPPISTVLSQKPVIGTPIKCNSGSFVNARERVEDVGPTLKRELGRLHVDIPNLLDTIVPRSDGIRTEEGGGRLLR
ncbi:hypothetical protein E4U51_004697 [Claviceps purpurea]|nr:hypothetical protein E4U51_004697 [Claviceps purpurea]